MCIIDLSTVLSVRNSAVTEGHATRSVNGIVVTLIPGRMTIYNRLVCEVLSFSCNLQHWYWLVVVCLYEKSYLKLLSTTLRSVCVICVFLHDNNYPTKRPLTLMHDTVVRLHSTQVKFVGQGHGSTSKVKVCKHFLAKRMLQVRQQME